MSLSLTPSPPHRPPMVPLFPSYSNRMLYTPGSALSLFSIPTPLCSKPTPNCYAPSIPHHTPGFYTYYFLFLQPSTFRSLPLPVS